MRASLYPTHPDDCKRSGSFLYDMFMGVELNPRYLQAAETSGVDQSAAVAAAQAKGQLPPGFKRFFQSIDAKLFHNGRPGIVAWTLVNVAFATKM